MKHRGFLRMVALFWFMGSAMRLVGQTIIGFDPMVGSPGDQVTITGSGFSLGTVIRVYFYNERLVLDAGIISDSLIIATVPNGASTGPITIQRDSDPPVSSGDIFTAIGPGPYISDVSPTGGSVDDLVLITGVHLQPVSSVKFNGKAALDPNPNAAGTQIGVHVPAGATSGPISVTTPAGTSNSPAPFTVLGPGPFISGFSPTFGNAGTKVSITGVRLGTVNSVQFNGVAAFFTASSETLIQATVPASVRSGPLTVISPSGTNTTSTNFFGPPAISGFSPATGRSATNMVINGTNLLGATTVLFGGTAATVFNANDNNAIFAVTPAGAHSGPIQVFTPGFSVQTKSNFTFQPTVSSFVPTSGKAGDNIVLLGANLNEGLSHVKFNGVDATFSAPQYGQVSAKVPAGTSTGPISVTTTNGTFTTSSSFFLPAVITGFGPTNSAPGSTVTIRGVNFLGTTAVLFNGQSATFNVADNNSLTATVPSGVTTGPISIATPANTATSGTQLFYAVPVVSSFNPTHGLPGAAVTISGMNFLGATAVRFNGVNVSSLTVVNNTTIQTTVPATSTGPVTVAAPAGTGTSSANFVVDLISDLFLKTVAAPDPVFWGSNLVYTITVTNAGPSDATHVVVTDPLPASLVYKSATATRGTVSSQGNTVVAAIGTLINGDSAQVTVTAVPQILGYVTNVIRATSDFPDPTPSNSTNFVATLVLPLPFLEIRPYSPSQMQISWPVMLTNYLLESKNLLNTNVTWSNVPGTPIISGTNKSVIEVREPGIKYYRLRR